MEIEGAIIQVVPFDQMAYSEQEQFALQSRFGAWYASIGANMRMYALTEPYPLTPVLNRIDQQIQLIPRNEGWRRNAMSQYGRFVEARTRNAHLKTTRCFFQVFGTSVDGGMLARGAGEALRTRCVQVKHLPRLVEGSYREHLTCLTPEDSRLPWITFLHSFDMRGGFSTQSIFDLIRLPYPIALFVDVHTVAPAKAPQELNWAWRKVLSQMMAAGNNLEIGVQEAGRDIQRVMQSVERDGQGLHRVIIGIGVMADTEDELKTRVKAVKDMMGRYQVKMRVATGTQRTVKEMFEGAYTSQGMVRNFSRNVESIGLPAFTPFGYSVRSDTDGILWGIDKNGGYPIFADRFKGASYNKVVLGTTGSGKTWTEFMLAYRGHVAHNERVLIIDPQRNARDLTLAVNGSYNRLDLNGATSINVLDWVQDGLAMQTSYVMAMMRLMLGRDLTSLERAALDVCLLKLYEARGINQMTPLTQMPILSDLYNALPNDRTTSALRRDLERFIDGSLREVFNRHTTIDVRLEHKWASFDTKDMADSEYEPLFLFALLNTITREVQRKQGDTRQRGVIVVDEFGILSKNLVLAQAIEILFRRVRVFGWGITAIDQTPATFLNAFPGIFENTRLKMIMKLEPKAIPTIAAALNLTAYYQEVLQIAEQGEGVLMIDNRPHHFRAELSPAEYDLLERSTIRAQ